MLNLEIENLAKLKDSERSDSDSSSTSSSSGSSTSSTDSSSTSTSDNSNACLNSSAATAMKTLRLLHLHHQTVSPVMRTRHLTPILKHHRRRRLRLRLPSMTHHPQTLMKAPSPGHPPRHQTVTISSRGLHQTLLDHLHLRRLRRLRRLLLPLTALILRVPISRILL